MMYILVRLLVGLGVYFVLYFLIGHLSKSHQRRRVILAFIVAVLLATLLVFVPVENVFISFSSPEASYYYNNSGKVKLVVHGEYADFVVGDDGGVENYVIIPKTAQGWKVGMSSDIVMVAQKNTGDTVIFVYQYPKTSDFFITIWRADGGRLSLSDDQKTTFQHLNSIGRTSNQSFYSYYAHINFENGQYDIIINGVKERVKL